MMQIELTETNQEMLCNLIRNEFDDCNPKVHWMYQFVSKLYDIMVKLDSEQAREMYHDIELEYDRPPQIETT